MKTEAIQNVEVMEEKRRKKALIVGILVGLVLGAIILFFGSGSVLSTLRASILQ